jgi:predicted permease
MLSSFLDSFFSVGQNVLILFIMIGMGAACKFARLMNDEGVKGITNLELSVVTPCLLIMSFQREYGADQLKTIGLSAAIAVAFHALSILLAHLLIHDRDASRQAVLRFSTVFTNAGFMSLPLQYALLGADGVFCGAVVVGFFQVLVWTYGVWLMGGTSSDFSLHHILLNPGVCGIAGALLLFVCRIRLPHVVAQPLNYMAALNTPVAMVIIGYHLASSRFGAALRDPKAILAMALRLVVSPAITLAALWLLGLRDHTIFVATVVAASAPVAAITTMFAVRYDHKPQLSVELVSISTLLSVVTMPFIVGVADWLTK